MSKKSEPSGQLSWLDMVEKEEQQQVAGYEDLATDLSLYTEIPEYFVRGPMNWPDGDRSPEQVERLSHVLLGDTTILTTTTGYVLRFINEVTVIIGTDVWVACRFDKEIGKNHLYWQQHSGHNIDDDDGVE